VCGRGEVEDARANTRRTLKWKRAWNGKHFVRWPIGWIEYSRACKADPRNGECSHWLSGQRCGRVERLEGDSGERRVCGARRGINIPN
jgi:hypothetical protein